MSEDVFNFLQSCSPGCYRGFIGLLLQHHLASCFARCDSLLALVSVSAQERADLAVAIRFFVTAKLFIGVPDKCGWPSQGLD
jgi:hypothetical protein